MSTVDCPNCGTEYKKVGQHWAKSDCGFPDLTDRQKEIIQGLLMGDASVEDRGSSGRLTVQNTNREFLEWVDEELGVFSLGVKNYYTAEEQRERVAKRDDLDIKDHHEFDVPYELKTRSHPYFKHLRSWYSDDGKVFPADLTLTPLKAKAWYACDGSLINPDDQRPHARFYTKNERNRLRVLVSYFTEQELSARPYSGSVGFTADGTKELCEWMGSPPNGMEYKWV